MPWSGLLFFIYSLLALLPPSPVPLTLNNSPDILGILFQVFNAKYNIMPLWTWSSEEEKVKR